MEDGPLLRPGILPNWELLKKQWIVREMAMGAGACTQNLNLSGLSSVLPLQTEQQFESCFLAPAGLVTFELLCVMLSPCVLAIHCFFKSGGREVVDFP